MSRRVKSEAFVSILANPVVLALLATAASIGLQGFSFGFSNNVFHIPIVLRFQDLGQFANDPAIQSLNRFVSPVYLALALVANEQNIESLFLVCHILTRVLTFMALIRIVTASGVRSSLRLLLTVAAMVLSPGLYGLSPMGGGGLLLNYFTHSELSTAFALLAVGELLRGRIVLAAGLSGVAFALNAFIGIWMLVPVGLCLLMPLSDWEGRRLSAARWLRQVFLAGLAFAVPALPVVVWVLRSTTGQVAVSPFNYREYLYFYFGKHFFVQASSAAEVFQSGSAVLAGLAALLVLPTWRRKALPIVGLTMVLGVGAVVGLFASSRLVLNLHLIRVDALLIMLTTAYVAAAAAQALQPNRNWRNGAAILALGGLLSGIWSFSVIALIGLRLSRGLQAHPSQNRMAGTAIPALCVALVLSAGILRVAMLQPSLATDHIPDDSDLEGMTPHAPEWLEMQQWARRNTPVEARFLVPYWPSGFRIGAQRSVWVDFKQGATTMWAPDTYADWRRRVNEVGALRSLSDQCAYARIHGLGYVIIDLRPGRMPLLSEELVAPLHENRFFRAYDAARC